MKKRFIILIVCMMTAITTTFSTISVYASTNINADVENNSTLVMNDTLKNEAEYAKEDNSSKSWRDNIHTVAQNLIDNAKITGIQYALIDNGQVMVSDNAGVYSKNGNVKLNSDNMFGIGSVSKMFVTASVLKLVDEGKVELDEPVVNYIPDFTMADERYKEITVRMLLNHSSGLMGTEYTNSFLYDDNDSSGYDNLLNELKTQRLKSDPGKYSVYCNDGFSLAQLLVERVSGSSFTSFIHDNFTTPLGLENIKTPLDKFDTEKLAKNYDENNVQLPQDCTNIIGTGGIYSNAEDLAKFAQIFNKPGTLSEKSINEAMENESHKGIYPEGEKGSFDYGLGWDNVDDFDLNRYGIKAVIKGGDTMLYHGSMINIPEYNISVAVLSSGGSSMYNELIGKGLAKQYLKEKGIIKEILPDEKFANNNKAQMPDYLREYSGIYMIRSNWMHIEFTEDGIMQVYTEGADDSQKQKLYYTEDGYFTDESGTTKYKFEKASNGNVYLRAMMYVSLPGVAQIKFDYYYAQKVDDNSNLSENIKKAWSERNNEEYFLINEKYTSQLYYIGSIISKIMYNESAPGYIGSNKITGENEAQPIIEIPGALETSSRDLNDINIYNKDNCEYMKMGSYIWISSKNVGELNTDINDVKIGEDGYAKWFKVSNMNGKVINVNCPEKGAFAVYDSSQKCLNYSYVSKNYTVNLDDAAYVVFMGDKDSEFKLSITQK